MSSANPNATKVVPAQLATLSIYNPSLGATDETVRDQILYHYSRSQRERKEKTRGDGSDREFESEEEENHKLRQIGLAQGMVDFAANFADGKSVDSVDTEKSRIILHELERGWWVLASIDLTHLPHAAKLNDKLSEAYIEYSAREVAPAQLLLQQLLRAQSIFLLHHASTLGELYQRSGRPAFASLLEKYWTSFANSWDVLLHGNPVTDLCNGIKLAAGGELGVGVGEEEWGSGEREVLEDFVTRTEGLTDLVVSRFGDAPEEAVGSLASKAQPGQPKQHLPWLGTGEDPRSSDGVIFSGTGAISRRSLATVSQWMEAIFKSEEDAYGVGENPSSRHRGKRRKLARKKPSAEEPATAKLTGTRSSSRPRHGGQTDLRREAIERNAAPPGIPPSLVPIVEQKLDQAVAEVDTKGKFASKPDLSTLPPEQDTLLFDTDKMMSFLKLGYGSSWTLSPKGLPGNKMKELESSSQGLDKTEGGVRSTGLNAVDTEAPNLQEVDPEPEVSDEDETPFVQRLEQSIGKFIIGLSGDLENTEFENVNDDDPHPSRESRESTPQRVFLRTVTVGMSHTTMGPRRHSRDSAFSGGNYNQGDQPPTSASASIDGAQSIINHKKLQVAVYVHQPFVFLFLFELHTPNLTMPSFYRNIHHQLGPLQKPLLSSTDPAKVALRISDAMGEAGSTTTPTQDGTQGRTIYDIIHDPVQLTVRTSLPNIPLPGSLAAEGLSTASSSLTVSGSWYTLGIPIGSAAPTTPSRQQSASGLVRSDWTRVEALNVYTQMLNTWVATRDAAEVERTVKTGRGWWILWMQVDTPEYGRPRKEAFLVRKAADHKAMGASSAAKSRSSGKWLLRDQSREVSGGSSGGGEAQATTNAAASDGVGVDAKRWVDGLLHLSR